MLLLGLICRLQLIGQTDALLASAKKGRGNGHATPPKKKEY
jgi:hypothetical protein